ncbi:cold shock domain-containing protein [Roseicyclus sp. F158]|uniref:Cold shock domain-containing protein n=1 Tax=Tropicimonas omnivorans TaxID=3075590 RepID=A0ABU3DL09_9RHOB|nr:cold shock domain-containing protein [Roseicyclus sp. F158]MDT0683787.1 cold shock domain-containing protein [Roseicyclus sp. F158]
MGETPKENLDRDARKDGAELEGRVKWFDPGKGFGFVVADEGGADILLHANVLRMFGQSSVADSSRVVIRVQETERGRQAVEVLDITADLDPEVTGEDRSGAPVEIQPGLPLEPARVKWFDKAKGFGFANVFGRPEDVFIHMDVLRRSGLADLQPGEAVGLRSVDGPRGKMAVEVAAWERATREEQQGEDE